jgi:hypothetical protein
MKSTATEGDVQMNFFADNGDHFWTMGVDGTVDKFVIDNSSLNGTHFVILDSGNTGIGTASPNTNLDLTSASDASVGFQLHSYSTNGGNSANINLRKSNHNTVGSTATTNDGDYLGVIQGSGIDTGGSTYRGASVIYFMQDGSAGSNKVPGRIEFATATASAGATTRMKIDSNSRISLSNNDGGGTGGDSSTTGNTLFGHLIGDMDVNSINNTLIGHKVAGGGTHDDMRNNVAVGALAIYDITSGDENVAVGNASGGNITTGEGNTLVGYQSGNTGTVDIEGGNYNTIIGYQARGSSASAINQIVIGKTAQGQGNNTVTLGNADVTDVYMAQDKGATVHASNGVFIDDTPFLTIRDSSAYSAGTGGGVAFQGNDSGENLKQFSSIEGYSIGSNNGGLAIYTRDGGSNNLAVIVDNNRAIKPGADDAYDIGTSSLRWDDIFATNGTINTSDERRKDNIADSSLGLDFVNALRPVKYKWKDYSYDIEKEKAVEAKEAVYETVVVQEAVEAKEAVMGTRQKTVSKEVEKTKTEIVEEDGKYVQKEVSYTETVEEPQYEEVNLYDEDGEVIGSHKIPIMEEYEVEPAIEAVEEITEERLVSEAIEAKDAVMETKEKTFARTHFGLIAQEVEQVLKDSSLTNNDFAGLIYDEDADRYGMRYHELIAPLIKAVQELSKKVTDLENK